MNAAVKGTKKQIRMDVLQGGRKLRLHARKKTALSYEVFYEHGDAYKLAVGPHGRPIEASGRVNPDQGRLFMQFFLPPATLLTHFKGPFPIPPLSPPTMKLIVGRAPLHWMGVGQKNAKGDHKRGVWMG